jgi:ribulose-5-phosphate 4-epimerase/fuculose-1-phosphate aldolase
LSNKDYSFVSSWDIDNNSLKCSGGTKASSESMTHGAVYDCNSQIGAVVHIHNLKYWKTFINKLPTTNKHATYGTPEIANEIKRLYKETDFKTKKVAVLGGHKEGIISFGKNIKEAYNNILKYYNQLK